MKNTKATALRDALSSLKKKSMQSILITVGAMEPEENEEHEAEEMNEKMPEAGGGVYTKKRGMGRMSDADAKSIARKLMG